MYVYTKSTLGPSTNEKCDNIVNASENIFMNVCGIL